MKWRKAKTYLLSTGSFLEHLQQSGLGQDKDKDLELRSPTWVAGPQVFEPSPVSHHACLHISRKESEVEWGLEPRHLEMGCGCSKYILSSMPNAPPTRLLCTQLTYTHLLFPSFTSGKVNRSRRKLLVIVLMLKEKGGGGVYSISKCKAEEHTLIYK